MAESRTASASGIGAPDPAMRQIEEVVDRLARRFADRSGVHRDVIEAAVRTGWAKYAEARVTTYRAILAERAAMTTLEHWFGDARPASVASLPDIETGAVSASAPSGVNQL